MVAQTQRKPQTAIAPPKRATKTASALAAAHAVAEVKQKRKRTKQGCITCRVRGKVCTTLLSPRSCPALSPPWALYFPRGLPLPPTRYPAVSAD